MTTPARFLCSVAAVSILVAGCGNGKGKDNPDAAVDAAVDAAPVDGGTDGPLLDAATDALLPYVITPQLTGLSADTPAAQTAPTIAIAPSGVQLAVWTVWRSEGSASLLYAVYNGSTWSPEGVVAEVDGYRPAAVATNGTTFMVGYERDGHHFARGYGAVSGVWGAESALESGTVDYDGSIALASNVTGFIAAWKQYDADQIKSVYACIYAGGAWSPATLLEPLPSEASDPAVASNGSGYAVVFRATDLYLALWDGAAWAAPALLATSGSVSGPRIASNGTDYAVTWIQSGDLYANVRTGAVWSGATLIEAGMGGASAPEIAGSAAGYAVTWSQSDVTGQNLYANRYATGSWKGPILLETADGVVGAQKIASSGSDAYAVTWLQSDGTDNSVYANIHAGAAWGGAQLLETSAASVYPPQISGQQRYTVVWSQDDGAATTIYAARNPSSGSWAQPEELVTRNYFGDSLSPRLAANSKGERIAVWSQFENGRPLPYASIYHDGAWGDSARVGVDTTVFDVVRAVGNDRGFVTVWRQQDGSEISMIGAVYEDGAWLAAAPIETGIGNVRGAYDLASNGATSAALWIQYDGVADSVFGNVRSNGAWGGAVPIESAAGAASALDLAASPGGYGATWIQSGRTFGAIFDGSSWSVPQTLDDGVDTTRTPVIVSSGSSYLVAWRQKDGAVDSLQAAVYSAGTWSAPTLLETGDGTTSLPMLAASATGYAVAWLQPDATTTRLYTSLYSAGTWGSATAIENGDNPIGALALAANGNDYLVAFRQSDGVTDNLYASLFRNGSWSGPQLLETADGAVGGVQVASNGSGFAVTWTQEVSGIDDAFALVYNGVWGAATPMEGGSGPVVFSPSSLLPCASGYCTTWLQRDPTAGINASVYRMWAVAF